MSLDLQSDRTALLVLDLQNYGVHPEGYWMTEMPEVARIAIVHVGNVWREGHPDVNAHAPWMQEAKTAGRSVEDTWGTEFFEPVAFTNRSGGRSDS